MLESGLYERQYTIRLCLLAVLSGESVFLLGPPSIAKSLTAQRLKHGVQRTCARLRLSNDPLFYAGRGIRKAVRPFLPLSTNYGFVTAIRNRRCCCGCLFITDSNEFPEADSGLEAMYDRILIRLYLDKVKEKSNLHALLTSHADSQPQEAPLPLWMSDEEFQSWQRQIDKMTLPAACFELICLSIGSAARGHYISNQRWKKALRLLQASSFFSDCQNITPVDIILLRQAILSEI